MNIWVYRTLMTLLLATTAIGLWIGITTPAPVEMCVEGIVMVEHKSGDMWVQKGIIPTLCMPVDKD